MGGLTTPKGGATQTTTQQQQVPAYVQSAQQNLLNASNSVLSPYIQQQAYTQAGVNPDQTAAYDLTRSLAQGAFTKPATSTPGAYTAPAQTAQAPGLLDYRTQGSGQAPASVGQATAQGYTPSTYSASGYTPATYQAQGYTPSLASTSTYDAALAAAQQVDGKQIRDLLNPYTQDVVDTTLNTMGRQYRTQAANMGAKAAAAGAFGGSRQAIQSAQLDRSFGEQVASTTATLMSAGYDKATATALANAQMRQQTELANQSARNTAGQFNANANNTTSQFNAGAQNTAGQFLAGAQNTAGQVNTAAQNAAGQFLAGAQNTAGQANQNALNTAGQFGASAGNTASQYNIGLQATRDQFNATQGASQLQNYNNNALQQYQLELGRDQNQATNALSARQQDIAVAQLQEAIKSGDQTRQLAAINALLGIGDAQQKMVQAGVSTPLQYLQLLAQATPTNFGGTTTSTAPNQAQSPLQTILGLGTTLGTAALRGGI